jgi:hypothetical protein
MEIPQMSNETTSHDDSDAENAFEALAMDLLSGLLGRMIMRKMPS